MQIILYVDVSLNSNQLLFSSRFWTPISFGLPCRHLLWLDPALAYKLVPCARPSSVSLEVWGLHVRLWNHATNSWGCSHAFYANCLCRPQNCDQQYNNCQQAGDASPKCVKMRRRCRSHLLWPSNSKRNLSIWKIVYVVVWCLHPTSLYQKSLDSWL